MWGTRAVVTTVVTSFPVSRLSLFVCGMHYGLGIGNGLAGVSDYSNIHSRYHFTLSLHIITSRCHFTLSLHY